MYYMTPNDITAWLSHWNGISTPEQHKQLLSLLANKHASVNQLLRTLHRKYKSVYSKQLANKNHKVLPFSITQQKIQIALHIRNIIVQEFQQSFGSHQQLCVNSVWCDPNSIEYLEYTNKTNIPQSSYRKKIPRHYPNIPKLLRSIYNKQTKNTYWKSYTLLYCLDSNCMSIKSSLDVMGGILKLYTIPTHIQLLLQFNDNINKDPIPVTSEIRYWLTLYNCTFLIDNTTQPPSINYKKLEQYRLKEHIVSDVIQSKRYVLFSSYLYHHMRNIIYAKKYTKLCKATIWLQLPKNFSISSLDTVMTEYKHVNMFNNISKLSTQIFDNKQQYSICRCIACKPSLYLNPTQLLIHYNEAAFTYFSVYEYNTLKECLHSKKKYKFFWILLRIRDKYFSNQSIHILTTLIFPWLCIFNDIQLHYQCNHYSNQRIIGYRCCRCHSHRCGCLCTNCLQNTKCKLPKEHTSLTCSYDKYDSSYSYDDESYDSSYEFHHYYRERLLL